MAKKGKSLKKGRKLGGTKTLRTSPIPQGPPD